MSEFCTPGPPAAIRRFATRYSGNDADVENKNRPAATIKFDRKEVRRGPCMSRMRPRKRGEEKDMLVERVKMRPIWSGVRLHPSLSAEG